MRIAYFEESTAPKDKVGGPSVEQLVPWYFRYYPAFLARKRGFVPLAEFERISKENGELRAQLNAERLERLKDIIMRLVHSQFEMLFLPAISLSKKDMIADIKLTDSSFSVPSSIQKDENLSYHYVAFRCILKNLSETKVQDLKNFLQAKNIKDDMIARISSIFHKKASYLKFEICFCF